MGQGAGAWHGATVQVQIPPPQSRSLKSCSEYEQKVFNYKKTDVEMVFPA